MSLWEFAEVMSEPGAKMSTQVPTLERGACVYLSIRYTDRLAEVSTSVSVGSNGDCVYGFAETVIDW